MTTPTQAQIEAAAKAIHTRHRPDDVYTQPCEFCKVTALAALTAAAQVKPTVADLMQDPVAALNAAAQVGEPVEDGAAQKIIEPIIKDAITMAVNATIERCAQVALQWEKESYPGDFKTLIERLRALKDKP